MPDRVVARVSRGRAHIGPKQLFVIAAAVFCVLRGLAYVDPPPTPQGLDTLASVLPLGLWGWAWIIAGGLALAAVRWRYYAIALTPMLILCALWGFSYTSEWVATITWRGGESRGWITGVSYAFQAVAVLVVSRLVDPTEVNNRDRGPDA